MKAILTVLLILGANFLLNIERLIMTDYYYKKFQKNEKDMLKFGSSIERLLEKAGANEKVGYGRWCDWKVSHCVEEPDCRKRVEQCFKKAISKYKFRYKNAFNIFYILEYPSRKLQERGKLQNNFSQKVLTVFSGFISVVAIYFLEKILDVVVPAEWFSAIAEFLKFRPIFVPS